MKTLIIDDSSLTRRIISKTIGGEFEVAEAGNSKTAIELIGKGDIDFILLANTLTTENCYEVCRKIRDLDGQGGVPVCLMGTSDDPAHYDAGFQSGASAFLTKPFDLSELMKLVMDLSAKTTFTRAETALVVDDSRSVRLMLKKPLLDAGFAVLEAEDGVEGWELLQRSPEVTVVSTDCEMPRLDGIGFVKKIRSEKKYLDLPVLMLTSRNDQETVSAARNAGVDRFLTKPFQPDEYVKTVVSLLVGKQTKEEYTIFFADDSKVDRVALQTLLKKWGFHYQAFGNGNDLAEGLCEFRPDLVLLDLYMPVEDGVAILKRIRNDERLKEIPVIMISSFGNYEKISSALGAGVNDFVVKPFVDEEVYARILIHLKPKHREWKADGKLELKRGNEL